MPCGDFPEYNEHVTNSYTVNQPATSVCPNCGHCPTCGRGGYQTYPYTRPWEYSWVYWYPNPYTNPYQPAWTGSGSNTIPITPGSSTSG